MVELRSKSSVGVERHLLTNGHGTPGKEWRVAHYAWAAVAVLAYFMSGPTLIMLNKYIMSGLSFPFPIFVSNLGSVCLALITRVGRPLGLWPKTTTDLRHAFFRITLPLSVSSNMSLFTGNTAYLYIPVPLVQILKTFTLVLVMLIGFIAGTEKFSCELVSAILLIVTGVSISVGYVPAGGGEPGRSLPDKQMMWGMGLMLTASTVEAVRSTYMQIAVEKLPFFDTIYAGSLPNCLIGLSLAAIMEGPGIMGATMSLHLLGCLLAATLLGGLVILSNYWVAKLVGGLSMKVLVNARNIALVLFSVAIFGETCTNAQCLGYAVALAGLGLYKRAKQTNRRSLLKAKPL